ncbi:MAG: hypothetical protein PHZ09_14275, partial [Eubacteriales bacterium]|nr:hypothetical protein [Eubacteriales bacterium]
SNSCEAVVEMLSRIKSPLKFTEQQMLIDRDADDRDIDIDGFAVQQVCIYIMQDRSFSLPLRLARLCDYIWSDTGGFTPDTGEALNIMRLFTRRFAGRISIADYCGTAVRYYDTECARQRGSAVFEDAFPDWQVLFEHLLVNHMLYDEFPYSNGSDTRSAFTALAAAYAFLRYIAIAVCSLSPGTDTLTDLIAAMFRFIEHSRFESAAAALLGELNYAEPAKLKNLILI